MVIVKAGSIFITPYLLAAIQLVSWDSFQAPPPLKWQKFSTTMEGFQTLQELPMLSSVNLYYCQVTKVV